jgi:RNA polymerase sigma-70 factor (ECF subfamily)
MHDGSGNPALAHEPPTRSALLDLQRELLAVARRCSRSRDEAADLVQDVLALAVARGARDWSSAAHRAWLRGVTRKLAAFHARSAARRRRREASCSSLSAKDEPSRAWVWDPAFLSTLPRSLRVVAALVAADLAAAEIRWVLALTDTALRKRLSDLRKAVRASSEATTTSAAPPRYSFGPIRAEVLASLRERTDVAIATHDPDSHPLIFCVRVAHEAALGGNSSKKESSCPNQS